MTEDNGGEWPEQEIVQAWLKKHNIKVDWPVALELQEAVTAPRILTDRRLAAMTAEIAEQAKTIAELRDGGIPWRDGPPTDGADGWWLIMFGTRPLIVTWHESGGWAQGRTSEATFAIEHINLHCPVTS